MKLKQIANILNTQIVPNILGENVTLAEDLRDIVTLGKKISELEADDLKDYMKAFVLGVIQNEVDTRTYKEETFGIFINAIDYGGALQRTKAKLLKATDSNILTLQSAYANPDAPDYNDSKFWGTEFDSKVYTDDFTFRVKYSISTEMFKKSMMSAGDASKLAALVEANFQNTLTNELNGLAKAMLRKLALTCVGTREIKLLTRYNTEKGYQSGDAGFVTLANWEDDTNFKLWLQKTIIMLKKYVTDYNTKYNDGTIETFCPESEVNTILLTGFAESINFTQSSVYHKELTDVGNYQTVNFWQNSSDDLLPVIGASSVHDQIKETVKDSGQGATVTINHVVGMLFDRYTMGITNKFANDGQKITAKYVPEEDFTTYFNNIAKCCYLDTRNTGIILTLS